jgi:hypothetical protein
MSYKEDYPGQWDKQEIDKLKNEKKELLNILKDILYTTVNKYGQLTPHEITLRINNILGYTPTEIENAARGTY